MRRLRTQQEIINDYTDFLNEFAKGRKGITELMRTYRIDNNVSTIMLSEVELFKFKGRTPIPLHKNYEPIHARRIYEKVRKTRRKYYHGNNWQSKLEKKPVIRTKVKRNIKSDKPQKGNYREVSILWGLYKYKQYTK